ncbi:trifunctional histidinol dehydrogenase [Massospora cicadina]|nr:trifunctional histidinol dehydrogenase [Massospora cicadina]
MWHKGLTSGAFQNLKRISADCDSDTLCFSVYQHGSGFCHLGTSTCFGEAGGLVELEKTIWDRKFNAPEGSYTHRLFNDPDLLGQKLMEEAEELGDAKAPEEVAWEAADLIYFALVKCASFGVTLADVQNVLERKARKVTRRAGDAKPKWAGFRRASQHPPAPPCVPEIFKNRARAAASRFHLQTYRLSEISENERSGLLRRPILQSKEIFRRVEPILKEVRQRGDAALMAFTAKFDNVEVEDPTLVAPFPEDLMQLGEATRQAIDAAYARIHKFHAAQQEAEGSLEVETCPGVTCTRFSRPIQSVGLYVPGGTAVLPSTALMLGVPAMVAGCDKIVFATPPGPDGKVAPEVVYVAHKVGATHIVKAGGAQAIAALAYGTTKVPKVDKICGPGNQYVTGAKMLVQNDASAMVAIDMPAGPSEVLVIADTSSNPAFVASDLLSQAEHGPDSQCVLVTVGLDDAQIQAIMEAVASQAERLPRKDMVEKSLAQSFHLQADTLGEALAFSNDYAPEHLILQLDNPTLHLAKVQNAGSVFLGHYSPESCGDYASGTNHTLPTYGYARVHSGVSWATFRKFITSQHLTPEGLQGLGPVVETLARVEGLEAHAKAVSIRLQHLNSLP